MPRPSDFALKHTTGHRQPQRQQHQPENEAWARSSGHFEKRDMAYHTGTYLNRTVVQGINLAATLASFQ
jgi:hypothetical protein